MKYTPLVLLMGPIAFSVGKNHHLNLHSNHHHSRALDMTAGGYDKHPKGNFATSDGISPVPPIFENVLTTRNACCCLKGTQCTRNNCVGEPAFLIESVTVTTTLTSVIYHTSTIFDTAVSTDIGITTKFVTSIVTRDKIDVATVTNYVTSTEITKIPLPMNPKSNKHLIERRDPPAPPTAIPTAPAVIPGLKPGHNGHEHVALIPKETVTSYIYDFVFVWTTYSSAVLETSMVTSEVNSMSTQISTITSTLFKDAKSTTTVASTVVVTSTQVATSTQTPSFSTNKDIIGPTEPTTTKTPKNLAIETTSAVGTTSSDDTEAATETTIVDGGDVSGLQATTYLSTTMPRSSSSSSSSETASQTSSSTSTSDSSIWGGLSTGAKAGIGAGAGAAGLALLGIMAFFALGKRRRPIPTVSDTNAVNNWTPPPFPIRYSHLDSHEVSYTERAAALAHSMEDVDEPPPTSGSRDSQQSSGFGPHSRGASPSTTSELMSGKTEDAVWYMGLNTEHHEVFGQQYHEMPSFPPPSHSRYHGRSNAW
ncbi:hypothetical protein F5B18DRAFT_662829 [Nemania serpens]|nr:hypothetical protein F5B18DRAFT_662829 [Nemania serpens]